MSFFEDFTFEALQGGFMTRTYNMNAPDTKNNFKNGCTVTVVAEIEVE